MAFVLRHRIQSLIRSNRHFSSILSPATTTTIYKRDKTRAVLSLVKAEDSPEKIIEICRSVSLKPEFHLDRMVFSVAVSKLSKSNNFSYIQQLLGEIRSSRADLRSSERFASQSIILYSQAGMIDDAIRCFEEYHADVVGNSSIGSVKALNALILGFVIAKNFKELNRVFVEFPKIYNIEPNLQTFNHVTKALSESGSSSSCYSVLAEMDRKGVKPDAITFGNIISGFYIEEKYDDVGKILEIMKKYGIDRGLETYNIRIMSLCKLKRSAEAKVLFDGMLSRNVNPNSNTFSHLILGFCIEGNLEEAKKMFNNMVNGGIQPDSHCYFTLVQYLCKGGDFEMAFRVCNASLVKGWVPNCATMKSLVNGLARVGMVDEAKMLVREVKKRFSRNISQWEEVEESLLQ